MISKGQIMTLVYGENYTGIDSAIPQHLWKYIDTSIHVVNYNNNSSGSLENIIKIALSKGITLPDDLIEEEHKSCNLSAEYFYNNYCHDHNSSDPWYSPKVFAEYLKKANDIRNMAPFNVIVKKKKIVVFRDWNCILTKANYADGSLALSLTDADDGDPVATCSVYLNHSDIERGDIPSDGLHDDQCYIKTWGGNEGVLEALIEAKIVKQLPIEVNVGEFKVRAVLVELLK